MSKSSRTPSKNSKLPAKELRAGEPDKPADDDATPNLSKAARTREFIREQAAPIFNKQGFAGTSLGDLTVATGLSKGALYGNFKDKEGIALAAFGYSMEQIRKVMTSRLDPLSSNRQKLVELLNFFGEYVMHPPIPGGCPMINYGVEADDSQRFMRKVIAREMQSTMGFIQRCLEKGTESGEFKSDFEAPAIAQLIFCAVEGAIVVSRVTGSPAPMAAVVAQCRTMLDRLAG
ncbi:MAG TPA: TetR/AcrR family transcriptional regulator [Chryseolinea sp.]|nr:TetR/AcrR family transcriptional regulator [Chryseolinea sp.]